MEFARKVKSTSTGTHVEMRSLVEGTNLLVCVGNDGWDYDQYDKRIPRNNWHSSSKGKQIRISMNSPLRLTIDEFRDMVNQIETEYAEQTRD